MVSLHNVEARFSGVLNCHEDSKVMSPGPDLPDKRYGAGWGSETEECIQSFGGWGSWSRCII